MTRVMRFGRVAVAIGAAFTCSAMAAVTELSFDTRYEGPKELGAARLGLSFQVPAGWVGLLPSGSQMVVVGTPRHRGFVAVGAEPMTEAQLLEAMRTPVPLGDGVVLVPKGDPQRKGKDYAVAFTVQGAGPGFQAQGRARAGRHGVGAYVLALYPPAESDDLLPLMEKLMASVRFKAPAVPPAAPPAAGGDLRAALAGRKITRFYTGSGYSETESIYLCNNGNYYRNFEAGGFTPGVASGAMQNRNVGKWSVSPGQLVLQEPDGSRYTYSMQLTGGKLMLDGKRWFREATSCQ